MAGRICRRCGAPIEAYRSARAWLCSSCAHKKPIKGHDVHVRWCQKFVEARRRESAARVSEGEALPRDRAAVVYAVETLNDGPCVVEWRGAAPSHLRFVHGQGCM